MVLSGQTYKGQIARQWIVPRFDYVPASWTALGIWWQYYHPNWPNSIEGENHQRWERTSPAAGDTPIDMGFAGQPGRIALPGTFFEPYVWPGLEPQAYPRPSGGRDRLPISDFSPHEQTQWGYQFPEEAPLWWPEVAPFPGFDVGHGELPKPDEPGEPPSKEPSRELKWLVAPNLSRAEQRVRERDMNRKRGRREREKERKWKLADSRLYQIIGAMFGAVTEGHDMVHALWDALPRHRKGGFWKKKGAARDGGDKWMPKADAIERAHLVYKYFYEIDAQKALENILKMNLQDGAFGKAGQFIDKQSRTHYDLTKRPVGLQFGGWTSFG